MTLHPQVQALVDAEGSGPPDQPGPPVLAALRAGYRKTAEERGGAPELVDRVEDVVMTEGGGTPVRGRLYTPQGGTRVGGSLVWMHGGGWCIGDLEGFDRVARSLANAAGAEVLSVDYRLAPEHPFPAAIEDVDAAVRWACARGGAVAVGGDSAGGNLAAVAVRHARDDGVDLAAQLLVYPATDARMATDSYRVHAHDPMLSAEEMASCWAAYRGERPAEDPEVSPLLAGELAGLPPALVAVAGHDVLRSEGEAYAAALRSAGVETELEVLDDMAHGFLRWGGVVDRAGELVGRLGAFAAARLSAYKTQKWKRPAEAGRFRGGEILLCGSVLCDH